MDIRLDNRVALITGATGGIGSAIATEFYNSGATVVITSRSSEKIEQTLNKLWDIDHFSAPARFYGITADLSESGAEDYIIEQTIKQFYKLDILVNNAAITDGNTIIRSDENFIQNMMQINYQKPYLLARNALKYMRHNLYGRIINITSLTGQCGEAGMSAYAASKAALHSLSQSIATEYGKYNITANSIAPGFVQTDAIKKVRPEYRQNMEQAIPNHRFANPNEIADLATFLASERASYINGQQIAINGGIYR